MTITLDLWPSGWRGEGLRGLMLSLKSIAPLQAGTNCREWRHGRLCILLTVLWLSFYCGSVLSNGWYICILYILALSQGGYLVPLQDTHTHPVIVARLDLTVAEASTPCDSRIIANVTEVRASNRISCSFVWLLSCPQVDEPVPGITGEFLAPKGSIDLSELICLHDF